MFIDLCPQSFYGVYDWWGTPKPALEALFESNQPVAAMIEMTASKAEAVWLINDSDRDLGRVTVSWTITDAAGSVLAEGEERVACGPDSQVRVAALGTAPHAATSPINAAVTSACVDDASPRPNSVNRWDIRPAASPCHPAMRCCASLGSPRRRSLVRNACARINRSMR